MSLEKKQQIKTKLHPRNKNRERYDLAALIRAVPELKDYVKSNSYGITTVNFSNSIAVKLINTAILKHYYGIAHWEFPNENLCPPIPGRADYLHHIADLLGGNNIDSIPRGGIITCLDVGMGASCIYPIIGVTAYGWNFIGSDVDYKSIASAQHIINSNTSLTNKVECRIQKDPRVIFSGILNDTDKIDAVICNPPFHATLEAAQKATQRKIKNLTGKKDKTNHRNFAGITNELIYAGGEIQFIKNMIWESSKFANHCYWFSTLVSKQSNLKQMYSLLKKLEASQIKTIPMGTGNKSSRIVAWTFLSKVEQRVWRETRWQNTAK